MSSIQVIYQEEILSGLESSGECDMIHLVLSAIVSAFIYM